MRVLALVLLLSSHAHNSTTDPLLLPATTSSISSMVDESNYVYIAPWHDGGRFISYFANLAYYQQHYLWWDTGCVFTGSTFGYRYIEDRPYPEHSWFLGCYIAYDMYDTYTIGDKRDYLYRLSAGVEVASSQFGKLTANFYRLPNTNETYLKNIYGQVLDEIRQKPLHRNFYFNLDHQGVSLKWLAAPNAWSIQPSVVFARSWIDHYTLFSWSKKRVDRLGIGFQYALSDKVQVSVQAICLDPYQKGWSVGLKVGNSRLNQRHSFIGQIYLPADRHMPAYYDRLDLAVKRLMNKLSTQNRPIALEDCQAFELSHSESESGHRDAAQSGDAPGFNTMKAKSQHYQRQASDTTPPRELHSAHFNYQRTTRPAQSVFDQPYHTSPDRINSDTEFTKNDKKTTGVFSQSSNINKSESLKKKPSKIKRSIHETSPKPRSTRSSDTLYQFFNKAYSKLKKPKSVNENRTRSRSQKRSRSIPNTAKAVYVDQLSDQDKKRSRRADTRSDKRQRDTNSETRYEKISPVTEKQDTYMASTADVKEDDLSDTPYQSFGTARSKSRGLNSAGKTQIRLEKRSTSVPEARKTAYVEEVSDQETSYIAGMDSEEDQSLRQKRYSAMGRDPSYDDSTATPEYRGSSGRISPYLDSMRSRSRGSNRVNKTTHARSGKTSQRTPTAQEAAYVEKVPDQETNPITDMSSAKNQSPLQQECPAMDGVDASHGSTARGYKKSRDKTDPYLDSAHSQSSPSSRARRKADERLDKQSRSAPDTKESASFESISDEESKTTYSEALGEEKEPTTPNGESQHKSYPRDSGDAYADPYANGDHQPNYFVPPTTYFEYRNDYKLLQDGSYSVKQFKDYYYRNGTFYKSQFVTAYIIPSSQTANYSESGPQYRWSSYAPFTKADYSTRYNPRYSPNYSRYHPRYSNYESNFQGASSNSGGRSDSSRTGHTGTGYTRGRAGSSYYGYTSQQGASSDSRGRSDSSRTGHTGTGYTRGRAESSYYGYTSQQGTSSDSRGRSDSSRTGHTGTGYTRSRADSSSSHEGSTDQHDNSSQQKAKQDSITIEFAQLVGRGVDVIKRCSTKELGTLYRQATLRYHPDKHPGASGEQVKTLHQNFTRLSECYEQLLKQE